MLNTSDGSFDTRLQQMRCDLAALNVELKLCKLAHVLRKYSPGQRRVPAGSPEGGEWASGGGGAGGGTDQESDAEPGSIDEGRSAAGSGNSAQSYTVDLEEQERRGGHAIEGHLEKAKPISKSRYNSSFNTGWMKVNTRWGLVSVRLLRWNLLRNL
jgi:hypothetical protein